MTELTDVLLSEEGIRNQKKAQEALRGYEQMPMFDPFPGEDAVDIGRGAALVNKWGVKEGQLWIIPSRKGGEHRLVCGDCTLDSVRKLSLGGYKYTSVRPATCVTDPPYDVSVLNDLKTRERNRKPRLDAWLDVVEAGMLLEDLFTSCPSDVLVMTYPWARHFVKLAKIVYQQRWDLLYECLWLKSSATFGANKRFQARHEPILFFRRKGKKGTWNVPHSQTTVFEYPRPKSNPDHPTPKPVGLWEKLITFTSNSGDGVWEPFMGSGTTMVAAERTGRICLGVEREPIYVAATLERLSVMGLKPSLSPMTVESYESSDQVID